MSQFDIEVSAGSSVRLPTAGKYCEKDIVVTVAGGDSVQDFLALKESMTVYRNDEITEATDFMFAGCKNLKHVILPQVIDVKPFAFTGCTSLKILEVGTTSEWYYSYSGFYEEGGDQTCFDTIQPDALVLRKEPCFADDPSFLLPFKNIYIPREYFDIVMTENNEYGGGWASDLAYRIRIIEDFTVDGTVTGELDVYKMQKPPNVPH